VQQHLKKLYQRNSTILYEISPEPLRQEVVAFDFLKHLGEAKMKMPANPLGPENISHRIVTDIAQDWRHSLAAFPSAEIEFRLTLPAHAVMRFGVGRRWVPCDNPGSFQVWISPVSGNGTKLYERILESPNPTSELGWFDEQIDLGAYSSQEVAIRFKTDSLSHSRSCDWFLWADPQIISEF
jgi:hypothetical protein